MRDRIDMHTHTSKYTFGDIVYLRTDTDQKQYMVIGLKFRPGARGPVYLVGHAEVPEIECYECEISDEIDMVTKTI